MAPNAAIILVEAASENLSDLMAAEAFPGTLARRFWRAGVEQLGPPRVFGGNRK